MPYCKPTRVPLLLVIFSLFLLFSHQARSQDTIPQSETVDSLVMDTIVIRRFHRKVISVPRGVNLTNPVISFKQTQPLSKPFKRFRIPSFWERKNNIGVTLNEVAFINWNAGGDNSVSALGNAIFSRNYKFSHIQWDNELRFKYGINAQEGRKFRKTDDAIRLSSTFGYRRDTISPWYYSIKGNFNTQFSNGYKYPNRDNPISRFMAPGYLFFGAGVSYIPDGQKFNLYMSPITSKTTFVIDDDLANKGAFGVARAIYDDNGNIIKPGEDIFWEFGALIALDWEKQLAENTNMKNRLSLYTDYIRKFGNIDVDWEMNLILKVNEFITSSIGTHIIYDDDIRFDEEISDTGVILNPGKTRIQFKQILGIGINYIF